jgi:predicted esterase
VVVSGDCSVISGRDRIRSSEQGESSTAAPNPTAIPYVTTRNVPYIPDGDPDQVVDIHLADPEHMRQTVVFVLGRFMPDFVGYFAERGYPVIAAGYRTGRFDIEMQDLFCALAWTHANAETYGMNPQRIVLVGGSMFGGSAAILGSAEDPAPYLEGCQHAGAFPEAGQARAVVALAGVFDYSHEDDFFNGFISRLTEYMGGTKDDNAEKWVEASAISWIDGDEPPFLLVHGLNDANVDAHQSEIFAATLVEAGVTVETVYINDMGHRESTSSSEMLQAVEAFFVRLAGRQEGEEARMEAPR